MLPKNSVILYVEDDLDDQTIFKECLHLVRPDVVCQFANDGASALDRLTREFLNPTCVFIDLNMPVMDGHELLTAIKTNPSLSHIPCFILSTSRNQRHIESSLSAGAEKYLVKPAIYIDFRNLLEKSLYEIEI